MEERLVQEEEITTVKKERLWTLSFLLLWQGQLISNFGDILYEIALGFWVFQKTNSTALMGTLMMVTTIPRFVLAPFAGVIVDRSDRKKILVLMDTIRGIAVTFVGIAAIFGFIEIWMVFVAGITISLCSAFFQPSVSSTLPDITSKEKLVKANSIYGLINSSANILGNPIGGKLLTVLGAPLMFLANGISYLLSAFSMVFMKVPKIQRKDNAVKKEFFAEMDEGFKFIWKFKGLRNFMIMAAAMNFFASMGMVLFIPFFNSEKNLGAGRYGIAMAVISIGLMLGMLITSIFTIKPEKRYEIFTASFIISISSWAIAPLLSGNFILMLIFFGIAGVLNSLFNVLFSATTQVTVPTEMRGKVFSFLSTMSGGLTPLGFGLGGVLAEFLPMKVVMSGGFLMALIVFLPIGFTMSTKRFIRFDPEKEQLEEIINI